MACTTATAAPEHFELVIGSADHVRALRMTHTEVQDSSPPPSTPLGSLWKLFVYAYLIDRGTSTPDYQCTGGKPAEEIYCCAPGEHINREQALAKSCGLYFSPKRLNLQSRAWKAYWNARTPKPPAWLTQLDGLGPDTEVPVQSVLAALASLDENTRQQTMHSLLRVSLEPRARPLLAQTGTNLRVKTWSWHDRQGQRIGGFAGWLADGTPIWLSGPGTSATVIEKVASKLPALLPAARPGDDACVVVRFFNRYPLAKVESNGRQANSGTLVGPVSAHFRNGQRLTFDAAGKLTLTRQEGSPRVTGRFGLNDYVARVIQREAAAQPTEAARALGVAARTYLVRHADFSAGCYRIDDDSRTQRVSPAPPTRAALAAAQWSDGLILSGVAGRFHQTQSRPQQLSWLQAVLDAKAGRGWDEILDQAYDRAGFGLIGDADADECQILAPAEQWLATRQASWKRPLQAIPGFDQPERPPRICLLRHGNPYADIGRGRIYATGVATANERLTVVHEFLHFGLANHPRGRDEAFVEQTARQLLGLQ
jgi:uncharacterized protein YfaQ (DUF2300 family)